MRVRVINETGHPGDTRVEDENGDGIACIGVEMKINREGCQAAVIFEAHAMNIVGEAAFFLLDPHANKMKGIKSIEFTDGTKFDVPTYSPKIAIVRKDGIKV